MLKKIGLKNVRSFKDLKDLEIKPITVLCGTNSSGKSTILKSLLLWKQTLENLAYTDGFLLNGRYTNLGTPDDLLHNNTREKVIKFNFQFQDDLYIFNAELKAIIHKLFPKKTLREAESIWVDFTIGYKIDVKSEMGIDIKEYNLKIIPIENNDTNKSTAKRLSDDIHDSKIVELKISSISKNKVKIEWKNLRDPTLEKSDNLALEKLLGRIKALKNGSHTLPIKGNSPFFSNIIELTLSKIPLRYIESQVYEGHLPDGMAEFVGITQNLKRFLDNIFSGISYLGPLREEPSRRYIYDNPVNDIGIKGENSAFLYNKFRNKIITYRNIDGSEKEHVGPLEVVVRDWLDEIGIFGFDSKKTPDDEIFRFYLSSNEYNFERVNIADVGFGVSQVVPIVIAGLLMDSGDTLILEQPEIHLHPKMQMKLADFILSMSLNHKKFIIETHSEHIINRCVRRIVEDEGGLFNSLIGINFVKNTGKGSKIETVKISEKNGIENWPNEFFDQSFEEQQKIMNAIIKNRKNR